MRITWRRLWDGRAFTGRVVRAIPEYRSVEVIRDGDHMRVVVHESSVVGQ